MMRFPRLEILGEGRPVILLHGWSAHGGFFEAQKVLAGQGMRLVIPDLPGHGPKALAHDDLTIADLSAALASEIAARKLENPVLVGWSMGAFVALDYLARKDAVPVAGLVIIDMAPKVSNDATWRLGLANGQGGPEMLRSADEMARNWPAFAPRIARALFARGSTPDPTALSFANEAMAANAPASMAALWRSLAVSDYRTLVSRLNVPVLAIMGEGSRVYAPGTGDWYAASGGEIMLRRISAAGHAPHIEQPELFNAALAAFIEALPGWPG